MNYDVLLLIGRLLFGGFFLKSGLSHFLKMSSMKSYAQSKGVPMPALAVGVSGIMLILAGIYIILGFLVVWAVVFIVTFLLITSLKMHSFWSDSDATMKMMNKTQFMKNMALIGAALMILSIPMPWLWSI